MFLVLVSLLASQDPGPARSLDATLALDIAADEAPLEGHGPAAFFEHEVRFAGTLHVWARCDVDLFLRVEDETAGGSLLAEDDDSGGGTTPYVKLQVEPGTMLAVFVATAGGPAAGELHLVAAPETEATRAAADLAEKTLAAARSLLVEGAFERARAEIRGALAELTGCAGTESSQLVAQCLWKLARDAKDAEDEHAEARALDLVMRHRSRTLPEDHLDLQKARGNLAISRRKLGDPRAARALEEGVLAAFSRSFPEDHPLVLSASYNLATSLWDLGELPAARALYEKVLALRTQSLPSDHPEVLLTRKNLAGVLLLQGNVRQAHEIYEAVLRAAERTLPEGDPQIELERMNLAVTTAELGDQRGALRMHQRVVEALERVLPDDDSSLQDARLNLADALTDSGERTAARALREKVLEVESRTLPADHPRLQLVRLHLADTLFQLGELEGARALQESALANYASFLPDPDHPDLQMARQNLAATIKELGELERARALELGVVESYTRTLPPDHPDLQRALANLGDTEFRLGELESARGRFERALEVLAQLLPRDHPDLLLLRNNLALCLASMGAEEALAREARELARGLEGQLWAVTMTDSPREIEERVAGQAKVLSALLRYASGNGTAAPDPDLERQTFELIEMARSAGVTAAAPRAGTDDAETSELRIHAREASSELARLARAGGTREDLVAAMGRRDRAHAGLRERLAARPETAVCLVEPSVEALTRKLQPRQALVGYWRYARAGASAGARGHRALDDSLLAFVLRGDGKLRRVELGPLAPIEDAARAWREALQEPLAARSAERGVAVGTAASSGHDERGSGAELRRLVLDPLRAVLGDAEHLIVALDDVLHAVPLDALPDGDALLGQRFTIEVRSTLRELLWPRRAAVGGTLVALGGAAFDSAPAALEGEAHGAEEAGDTSASRSSAALSAFPPLPFTAVEARGIAELFALAPGASAEETPGSSTEGQNAVLLEGERASRQGLERLAPRARWLHLATHGWFAPESVPAGGGSEDIDPATGIRGSSFEERVLGASPMVLCGLALAGANLPHDAGGRSHGMVTAEEVSSWDLSGCELAVLSACDTGVGVRRAGQGVSSLQKALSMAGARSVVTSLWKVPDQATQALMLDFYRRLWVEKEPKWRALWEAKMEMRNAREVDGRPRYSTRDWAAWVLTGDPQ